MSTRRALKLILAAIFVSGVMLCWNLQRDVFPPPMAELGSGRRSPGPASLAFRAGHSSNDQLTQRKRSEYRSTNPSRRPLVAVVSCQDRAPLTMVTLKSALMLSRRRLRFVIFADRENAKELSTQISRLPRRVRQRATFSVLPVEFPASARESSQAARKPHGTGRDQTLSDVGSEWRQLFKPCSAQRLFLPDLLKNEDAVLYVDTDTVFLRPVEQLWDFFVRMNESHVAAAVAESEDEKSGWYPRLARHPYIKPRGVNSAVMLLNLTRLRAFDWSRRVSSVYEEWHERIVWGDQDIINIVFSNHSDIVYILPCEWNFRPDHCQYASPCLGANKLGPGVLHGSRSVFVNSKQPSFRAVFRAIQQFNFRRKNRKLAAGKVNPKSVDSPAYAIEHLSNTNGQLKFSEDASAKSADYDYTIEEGRHQEKAGPRKLPTNGKRLEAKSGNDQADLADPDSKNNNVSDDGDDEDDDELSLKERLISPLTIGIFETVNTRCGRFLKAHAKRLARTLYARAADL